jgi:membrane-bound lytic murein transglycosylase B
MTTSSRNKLAFLLLAGLSAARPFAVNAQDYAYDPDDVERRRAAFIDRMVTEHAFEADALTDILGRTTIQQSALNAISRPVERVVPWYEYRAIFLDDERIATGARFWLEHEALVDETAERFALDPEMLLAIVGIESRFGERMGTYRVLDALSTLAFAYPPRADFFASELESFLMIYADEGPEVLNALGSYAGAMGAGQFIPSSYLAYGVDADGDGSRDLWADWNDILGSVANYFAKHGWRYGEPVAVPARRGSAPGAAPGNRLELDETVGSLRGEGYEFDADLADEVPAMLIAVEGSETDTAYWVGLHNFQVITRYNRSVKYALAALELSQAIRQQFIRLQGGSG